MQNRDFLVLFLGFLELHLREPWRWDQILFHWSAFSCFSFRCQVAVHAVNRR